MRKAKPHNKYYLTDKDALAFFNRKASPEFWDEHWQNLEDLQTFIRNAKGDKEFIPAVKRYLPAGSTVLEGGCGLGHLVHALQYSGYEAIGVDFASVTVDKIKKAVPELDVRLGDVRTLDLDDGALDGYVSVGVIEHFWDGYFPIIQEMQRTLRGGGFLFVSFPYLSPLRKVKIDLHLYPYRRSGQLDDHQKRFYQFALPDGRVQADLEALGFELREQLTYGALKGVKDEVALLRPWLQKVYDNEYEPRWKHILDKLFKPFASHSTLLVMQKVR